jgi:hypothetical protein
MLRVYEELAARFVKQNEPRFRDHCLVLAADAALSAGRPADAERVRQRLLQYNPHHLVRPFATMAEAMQAPDVQEYVADLRRQWPPEFVQKLYLGSADEPSAFESPVSAPGVPDPASIPPPVPMNTAAEAPAPAPVQAKAVDLDPPRRPVPAAPKPAAAAGKNVFRPSRVAEAPAPLARTTPAARAATPRAATPQSLNPVTAWLATMLYWLGIAIGLALFVAAFVWPLVD